MVTRYRQSWHLNEFTLVHVVRYRDPLNKKRFAVPFKTKEKAQAKMDQLKRDGVKEIEITQDTLRGNVKFKEGLKEERFECPNCKGKGCDHCDGKGYHIKEMKKDDAYAIGMAQAKKSMNDEPPLEKDTIKKGHKIAKAIMKEAMSPAQIKKLKDEWAKIKLMSPEKVKTLKNFLDRYSTDTLMQLAQSGINFVSNMARSVAMKRKTGDMKHAGSMKEELGKEDEPKVQKIIGKLKKASDAHAGQAKDLEKAMKEETTDSERMAKMRVSQMKLQTKLRDLDVGNPNDKTKIAITKNDLENIQMKMDQLKNKREQKEHPAKALYEKIAGLQKKAEKTGMPYSILKQVYNRGMAAWKGGHRPGTTPQQWAMARVNSFVTKSSGTWGGADKDLAKKVRSSK